MDTHTPDAVAGSVPTVAGSAARIVTVDLSAVRHNWRAISRWVAPATCAAVVKADAYGLGAARVVPALADAGCDTFFVATREEALALRRMVPRATLYVLDGLTPGITPSEAAQWAAKRLRPVLGTREEIAAWAATTARASTRRPAALHIDSGLHRLGLGGADVDALAADPGPLAALNVAVVMTHLASAGDPASPQNEAQRQLFHARAARLQAVVGARHRPQLSLAASDGILLGSPYHLDLVRTGYVLFGGQPTEARGRIAVRPVVQVHARVLQVREVERGEQVGYSATWTARRRSRIAIIASGYADGLARAASATTDQPGGAVAFQGRLAPIVGRVSMDLTTVDVTDFGAAHPQRGDLVERVGPTLPLEVVGAAVGTIGYEVLTGLSRRAQRVYVGGS